MGSKLSSVSRSSTKSSTQISVVVPHTSPSSSESSKDNAAVTTATAAEDSTISSFFYSLIPKDILGIPVNEIKKDIIDSRSQLSSL